MCFSSSCFTSILWIDYCYKCCVYDLRLEVLGLLEASSCLRSLPGSSKLLFDFNRWQRSILGFWPTAGLEKDCKVCPNPYLSGLQLHLLKDSEQCQWQLQYYIFIKEGDLWLLSWWNTTNGTNIKLSWHEVKKLLIIY